MTPISRIEPEFVEEVPHQLKPGKLYISIPYATAVHRCCCGCGSEVVTTLHPTRWALTYDGETASLHPSVGSWGMPCQSHYYIKRNEVRWAPRWPKSKIEAVRKRDTDATSSYFSPEANAVAPPSAGSAPGGPLSRVRRWLRNR